LVVLAVALVAQAQVAEIGGGHERRRRGLGVGDAERGVAGPQPRIHVVGEPGGVAEFEGAGQARR
jgi:hypothetical protein